MQGTAAGVRTVAEIPEYVGKEFPATFGQSIGEDGRSTSSGIDVTMRAAWKSCG